MAVSMQQSSPVAHWPVVLGVIRKRNVASLIDTLCPPHPAPVLSCGHGVEALLLAILAGHHALYKGGARLADRGMGPLLQPGRTRASRHAYRLGQILEALFAAPLNRVCGAMALHALEVSALAPPWRPQETTTMTLYGASEEAARPREGLVPPRPASGHSTEGRDDLTPVLLRLGVSREGLPLRLGLRDGNTSDRTEPPVAMEACVALGLDGVRGIGADSQADGQRPRGVCLAQRVGLITLVPRPGAVRQEGEAWGPQHGVLPVWLEKPGRTRQEPSRCWHGQRVVRRVPVADADGRLDAAERRCLVVHSSQGAQQAATAYAAAPATEAERVAEPLQRVEARGLACAADAEAASSAYAGRGQGRRGRPPRLWRSHVLHYPVEAVSPPKQRPRRGRPPTAEAPQVAVRSRLVVRPEALLPSEDA